MLLFMIEFPDPSTESITTESGNRKAGKSGTEIFSKRDEKILRCGFDEDIDLAGAPETLPRIETYNRRLASF